MRILDCEQGSPEWLAARPRRFCASEAPAMLGVSSKTKRTELLHLKSTGMEKEFSNWVQKNLLDRGHEIEAAARPIVEQVIGEELFPATGLEEVEGLQLLASFDGITMGEDIVWENKSWNAVLGEALQQEELPAEYWAQLEHQLLVSGAEKAWFTASDGTAAKTVGMWYHSQPERRLQIIRGWKQFAEDLANYKPQEYIPAAVAEPIRDLPALSIEISGKVVASNLAEWKEVVTERIKAINTALNTDQDFADAAKMVTFLDEGEKRIELVKSQAQAQATSIDEVFRALDEIRESMRTKRLALNTLVDKRKADIRLEVLNGGKKALADHLSALNTRIGKPYMPIVPADFVGAMKGKRSIVNLRDAVDTELARAKIEANALADRIEMNLKALPEEYTFLFADAAQIVLKASDDFANVVKTRVSDHKVAEEKRPEAIRAEEAAKLAVVPGQPTPAPTVSVRPNVVPLTKSSNRPSDDQIIGALALRYGVHPLVVIGWLATMDLAAATVRLESKELA